MMEESDVSEAAARFRWPTWSPDGNRVAFEGEIVGVAGPERSILWEATADGLRAEAMEELRPGALVYLQWESKGPGLLTLSENGAGQLRLARAGDGTALLEGTPLFISSIPRGGIVAHVFAGRPDQARLVLLEPEGGSETLTDSPGSFRAPCVQPDGTVYFTVREGDAQRLARWSRASGEERLSVGLEERAVLVGGPDGDVMIASGSTDDQEFERLERLDRGTMDRLEPLLETPFSAVFPLAEGRIAFVAADSSGAFSWHLREPRGQTRELLRFVPTEEEALRLQFFDQYRSSHSPIAPDGGHLVVAGVDVRVERLPSESQLYLVPLDEGAPALSLGPGSFGAWPPAR
jgi:hypothetical protein